MVLSELKVYKPSYKSCTINSSHVYACPGVSLAIRNISSLHLSIYCGIKDHPMNVYHIWQNFQVGKLSQLGYKIAIREKLLR